MDKQDWDLASIRADALMVADEHEHNRRKYHHDMTTTGTMRVPAQMIVDLIDQAAIMDKAQAAADPMQPDRQRRLRGGPSSMVDIGMESINPLYHCVECRRPPGSTGHRHVDTHWVRAS